MNEFTKEELEDLLEWGYIYCIDMPTISKMHHSNLLGKIESMIDNYCEHEFHVIGSGGDAIPMCCKCRAIPKFTTA